MTAKHKISIAVLSRNQDNVQLVNSSLRDAGHAAHCHWVETPGRFDDILGNERIELIILNLNEYPDSVRQVIKQKDVFIPEVPVIAISDTVDDDIILKAMKDGAADLVSADQKARLQVVVNRELRAFRVERALNSTLNSATEYRKQLHDYMQNSNTAIAYTQEGIITKVNNAWLALFEAKNTDKPHFLLAGPAFNAGRYGIACGAICRAVQKRFAIPVITAMYPENPAVEEYRKAQVYLDKEGK